MNRGIYLANFYLKFLSQTWHSNGSASTSISRLKFKGPNRVSIKAGVQDFLFSFHWGQEYFTFFDDNEDEYVYPDASCEIFLQQVLHSDITVLGHTHHSFIWCSNNKYLINPGSVGQPRDQSSLASTVVFDTSNKAIVTYKVKFDTEKLKREITKFDRGNEYLVSVLER